MASARYDVLGIGNAIVDVIARTEEDFLLKQGMNKGTMALIDEPRAEAIYDAMGPAVEMSGGSAANTIVGVAGLGARAAFIGKVKDDELGRAFAHDIRAAGVAFTTPPAADGASTARCYVLVTPDGERTMNTYLGAAQDLHPADIDAEMIGGERDHLSRRLFVGSEERQGRVRQGGEDRARGRAHGGADIVGRVLRRPLARRVPASDALAHGRSRFSPTRRSCTASIKRRISTPRWRRCARDIEIAVVTRSEKGCLVVGPDGTEAVPAFPVERVVDTTGAGDLFAAGFLSGLARGADDRTCGRLGALAAAEVIQHLGARPEASLRDLARENGLID